MGETPDLPWSRPDHDVMGDLQAATERARMPTLTGIVKYQYVLPVSAAALNPPEPTAEERARWAEAGRARLDFETRLWAALDGQPDGPMRDIAIMHEPHKDGFGRSQCHGCDSGWGSEDYPDWPCRTAAAIGAYLGVVEP